MGAEGGQRGDDAGAVRRDVVPAGPAGLTDEPLAAEVAQVVSGLPGVRRGAAHRAREARCSPRKPTKFRFFKCWLIVEAAQARTKCLTRWSPCSMID